MAKLGSWELYLVKFEPQRPHTSYYMHFELKAPKTVKLQFVCCLTALNRAYMDDLQWLLGAPLVSQMHLEVLWRCCDGF